MTNPQPGSQNELVEALAALEHEQWMHWSQAAAANVPAATREKWQRCWVDYAELPESVKEADRVWAREVIDVLRERKLIS